MLPSVVNYSAESAPEVGRAAFEKIVTEPEYLTLPAGAPDGVYIFQIAPWSVASSAIDWLLELEVVSHPTQTVYPFSGKLLNAGGFYSDIRDTLEITKSTDGSEVTYTIIQY
jgi:hypothetical protein